jgi:hypothetical protein
MCSSSREEVVEVFDALKADLKRAVDLTFDVLTTPERLTVLQNCEEIRRMLSAVEHPLINQLAAQADATELDGKLPAALADRLRISRAEASRRVHEAADLGQHGKALALYHTKRLASPAQRIVLFAGGTGCLTGVLGWADHGIQRTLKYRVVSLKKLLNITSVSGPPAFPTIVGASAIFHVKAHRFGPSDSTV